MALVTMETAAVQHYQTDTKYKNKGYFDQNKAVFYLNVTQLEKRLISFQIKYSSFNFYMIDKTLSNQLFYPCFL